MQFPKDELYKLHAGLVHYVAQQYPNYAPDYEELVQEGMVGLVKAYNTFDWSRGFKFATYASTVINNNILMYLRRKKKSGVPYVRFESVQYRSSDGEDITLGDMLGYDADFTAIQVREFIASLNERDKLMIQLTMKNMKQREIGDLLGISQSLVSRIVYRIGREYLSYKKKKIRKQTPTA